MITTTTTTVDPYWVSQSDVEISDNLQSANDSLTEYFRIPWPIWLPPYAKNQNSVFHADTSIFSIRYFSGIIAIYKCSIIK